MSFPYITQKYVSGYSGYRIWSDGFCEQWGRFSGGGDNAQVNLLKNYINTSYGIIMLSTYDGNSNGISYGWSARPTAKNYFNFDHLKTYSPWQWRTWGYIA